MPRQALIDTLRTRVEAVVLRTDPGRSLAPAPIPATGERASACSFSSSAPVAADWTFGSPEIDRFLPWRGLAAGGLHEVKPETPADGPAAQGLAAALLARRLAVASPPARPLLWAMTWRDILETGRPYGPGLLSFGLVPAQILLVEARRDSEVLWALEEGLRSGALAAVAGGVGALGLTAARRLALAAATYKTPCLLVTPARQPGVSVAISRWRVGAAPGSPHALDPALPAGLRFHLTLERCRGREAGRSWVVEWSDATFRFRLAPAVAGRAAAAELPRRRAG
ncbi:MAG: damage-inducible mutagenesis protein [Hyphomicrobiaceae bacterium]